MERAIFKGKNVITGAIVAGYSRVFSGKDKVYIRPMAVEEPDGHRKVFDFVEVDPESLQTAFVEIDPKKDNIRTRIAELQKEAEDCGAELHLSEDDLIDDDHLDCFWYGGQIGSIVYKGWEMSIEVRGDVEMNGMEGAYAGFDYRNRNNSGAYGYCPTQYFANDEEYVRALKNSDLYVGAGNWIEMFICDPAGEWRLHTVVLDDDNVLEAFHPVSSLVDWLEEFINEEGKV